MVYKPTSTSLGDPILYIFLRNQGTTLSQDSRDIHTTAGLVVMISAHFRIAIWGGAWKWGKPPVIARGNFFNPWESIIDSS